MHLVVYGSEVVGVVTINVDGIRCKLSRREDGTWALAGRPPDELRAAIAGQLGGVLRMLLLGDPLPPPPPQTRVRAVD